MPNPAQEELDLFMNSLEKALNEINKPGPHNTAVAVQAAKRAVQDARKNPVEQKNG